MISFIWTAIGLASQFLKQRCTLYSPLTTTRLQAMVRVIPPPPPTHTHTNQPQNLRRKTYFNISSYGKTKGKLFLRLNLVEVQLSLHLTLALEGCEPSAHAPAALRWVMNFRYEPGIETRFHGRPSLSLYRHLSQLACASCYLCCDV
jgi:hypothetical protein